MSKKRKRIRILRGKFYTTFHTGRLGHPSLVFRLDRKRNKYWIVVFDTTGRNDRIMSLFNKGRLVEEYTAEELNMSLDQFREAYKTWMKKENNSTALI